jgi:DNA-binding PadR family transcriptional regulator
MESLVNPLKSKIIFSIKENGESTAKKLMEENVDIPQATLYRYLKRLVSDGIIKVVEERKVRNVNEKVYAIAIDYNSEIEKMILDKDSAGENYLRLFQQFSFGLLNEFQVYSKKEEINILEDGSGFRITPFYATKEELDKMAAEVREVIKKHVGNKPKEGRELRNMAVIYTPPREE